MGQQKEKNSKTIKLHSSIKLEGELKESLEKLIQVVAQLRDPEKGCPWDLEQNHKSLTRFLIEESYEFIYSLDHGDSSQQCEELGDVLFQIILHAQIANEEGTYQLKDVARNIAEKLIRRHPHVFNNQEQAPLSSSQVLENWEKIKSQEKKSKGEKQSIIHKELAYRPSLDASHKIGAKSTKVGFDWENVDQVFDKVSEEWQEFNQEWKNRSTQNEQELKEELGDLLFSLAQLSRHLGHNAEELLREANLKFISRFEEMEKIASMEGKDFHQINLAEKERLWGLAKAQIKKIKNHSIP